MKVFYVAGHNQADAKRVADILKANGFSISSTWLDEEFSKSVTYSDADRSQIAKKDVDEIKASDALISISAPYRVPGGKFVEVGVALGLNKPIFLLGHRENMLMYHSDIIAYDSVENLIRYLLKY